MTAGATITYRTADDRGRRVRFEPLARPAHPDDWFCRITEEYRDGHWRETGREPVRQLEIETSDGTQVATVFTRP